MDWEWEGLLKTNCAVFFKVKEEFGGLSNMSNDFPLDVNGMEVGSTEALYQACRYPHEPDWQRQILDAPHAMRAKMTSKRDGHRDWTRPDWDNTRVEVMRWCLRTKLEQNFGRFFNLLKSTGDRAIVERSRRDRFWGAVPEEDGVLRGENMLGSLLVELRDEVVEWINGEDDDEEWPEVQPPAISNFKLLGEEIQDATEK